MAEKISQMGSTKTSEFPLNTGPQTTFSLVEPPKAGGRGCRGTASILPVPVTGCDLATSLALAAQWFLAPAPKEQMKQQGHRRVQAVLFTKMLQKSAPTDCWVC